MSRRRPAGPSPGTLRRRPAPPLQPGSGRELGGGTPRPRPGRACGASAAAPARCPSGSGPCRGGGRARRPRRGRWRCGSAGRPPGPAASPPAAGRSGRTRAAPSSSRRADSSGSSGRGNGSRSMTTRLSVRPGTSTPWKNPAVANTHVASSRGEAGDERRLGQVALGEDRHVDALAHRRGGEVHRLPAREQRQRAAAGGGDQGHQLVVHGVAVARRRGGRAGAARSTGAPGARSRTGCRRRPRRSRPAGSPTRAGSEIGIVALVSTAVRSLPDALAQDRADVERGDLQPRAARATRRRSRRSRRASSRARSRCSIARPVSELGAQLALLGVLDGRLDGGQRGGDPVEAQRGPRRGRPGSSSGYGTGSRWPAYGPMRLAQHVGEVDDAGEQLGVVEDPPQRRRPA